MTEEELNLTEEQKRIFDRIQEEFDQAYERDKIRAIKEMRNLTLVMTKKTVMDSLKQQYGLYKDNVFLKDLQTKYEESTIEAGIEYYLPWYYYYILPLAETHYMTITYKD